MEKSVARIGEFDSQSVSEVIRGSFKKAFRGEGNQHHLEHKRCFTSFNFS